MIFSINHILCVGHIQYNTTSNPIVHCPKMDGERRDTSASPGKSQQSRPFHEN